ncbi:MAG: uroporphyrinogen decarboxylase family protein [Melioribacteraceae bacterium]|nr:uroporphyrinogen decarboxylase family protein [Melioribacteraceae bacterium]
MSNRMNGNKVDKVPNFNIYMTFAARFINKPLSSYYLDFHTLVEANLAMTDNFDADIFQAISDPYRAIYDFGAEIEFPHDGLPISRRPLLEQPEDLGKIKVPKPESGRRMLDRLNGVSLLKQKSQNEIPVMGWVEGSLAESGNLRGISNILMDLYERPEWVKDLLEIITDLEIDFAIEQINAGADIIGVGDAIASQLSPELYEEFALPYEKRIFQAIKEKGAISRLHICGDTNHILKNMTESGVDIIDLDWMVDINEAEKVYGQEIVFCGNMDPVSVFLNGSEYNVYSATKKTLSDPKSRIISAGGCEIPIGTPSENIHSQNKALLLA